ncbi:MAG: homocysteine S-methyltransferase family protein [Phycisphaeraceae bacterium]|nr:homocysteine S-methyltransferase family protein [Phycisphaeraceae bacterium]
MTHVDPAADRWTAFAAGAVRLLDGAKGTELGARGVDLSLPLWSAHGVIDAPDVLLGIHRDHLAAGAQAVVANTFRTQPRTLARAGRAEDPATLTRRAVEIARQARDALAPEAVVFGCVAPLEDCYEPGRTPDGATCSREQAWMIDRLLEAGADAIAIETMGTAREALAAARAAAGAAPGRWMLSFCFKSTGPPGILAGGDSVVDMLPLLEGAFAVGVNCTAAPHVERQVGLLRRFLPGHVRVYASANVGALGDDGRWRQTDAVDPDTYAGYAERWLGAGATIVGGCCGTTPRTIAAMRPLVTSSAS